MGKEEVVYQQQNSNIDKPNLNNKLKLDKEKVGFHEASKEEDPNKQEELIELQEIDELEELEKLEELAELEELMELVNELEELEELEKLAEE